jgi:hypothetical protein
MLYLVLPYMYRRPLQACSAGDATLYMSLHMRTDVAKVSFPTGMGSLVLLGCVGLMASVVTGLWLLGCKGLAGLCFCSRLIDGARVDRRALFCSSCAPG